MKETSATLHVSIQPRRNACRWRWRSIVRRKVIRKDGDGWKSKEEKGKMGVVVDQTTKRHQFSSLSYSCRILYKEINRQETQNHAWCNLRESICWTVASEYTLSLWRSSFSRSEFSDSSCVSPEETCVDNLYKAAEWNAPRNYRGADKSLVRPERKKANVFVRMAWISFSALPCRGKETWWQLASRFCWNRALSWHASEVVSFLIGLRTYQ